MLLGSGRRRDDEREDTFFNTEIGPVLKKMAAASAGKTIYWRHILNVTFCIRLLFYLFCVNKSGLFQVIAHSFSLMANVFIILQHCHLIRPLRFGRFLYINIMFCVCFCR